MKIPMLIQTVFPPPRQALRMRELLSPVLFLIIFMTIWFLLGLFDILLFTRPAALWGLIVIPWLWWMHRNSFSGLGPIRGALALFIRLSLAGLLIMILAEPRAVRKVDDLSVLYVVDVSDSIGEDAVDAGLGYVMRTVTGKPQADRAGMVVFGRDCAVELPPRINFPFEIINSRISRDGTNLQKALDLALAVFPDDTPGRVVLISDGTVTEGNINPCLSIFASRGIPVDVLPIQYNFAQEVWVEKLELPRLVKRGETYEASIIVAALQPGSGELVFEENNQEIYRELVSFKAGKNRFVLPLYMREPGFYEYRARMELDPGDDGWENNNVAINYLYLKGEGKVLVVGDPLAGPTELAPLIRGLKRSGRIVVQESPFDLSRDALNLMPYDCAVLADVPADSFDLPQLKAFRDAVFQQGMGLIMLGSGNSFGPGGYHRTPLEECLPVDMDVTQKKVLPKGALVIVLHTCEFPEGNTWGKRIAKEAMRVLGEQDEVGILVYDYSGGESWLFPLTPAAKYDKLVTLVNQAQIGDMPSFVPTMRMGLTALQANDAAMKHMIIISDGDPSPPPPALLQGFSTAKISVSTIAINPHGGSDVSVMSAIASTTGGRYYFPQNPNLLPSIFIKEAKTLKRNMLRNITFTPRIEFPSPILKGIEALPQLYGYVLTTPKPRSNVVLRGPETEQIDPVLATWRFGLGKSAAFTSDFTGKWGRDWAGWERFEPFLKQLLKDISKVAQKSKLAMTCFNEGNTGMIMVEDQQTGFDMLDMEARITGPQDRTRSVSLQQTAPGRYEGAFKLWGKGRYQIMAAGVSGERQEQILGGFAVPYSPEYLRFRSDPQVLRRITAKTGGRILTGKEESPDIFPEDRIARASSRPVFDILLIVLACLIPLDVAIRRIQIDLYALRGFFRRRRAKEGSSDKTLGALLKVKAKIHRKTAHADEKPPSIVPQRREQKPAAPTAGKPVAPKPKQETVLPDQTSTTGRLLAARRKRQKDGDDDKND